MQRCRSPTRHPLWVRVLEREDAPSSSRPGRCCLLILSLSPASPGPDTGPQQLPGKCSGEHPAPTPRPPRAPATLRTKEPFRLAFRSAHLTEEMRVWSMLSERWPPSWTLLAASACRDRDP